MDKAKLLPLESKYYGTKVKMPWGEEVTFWLTSSDRRDNKAYVPSDRELAKEGITREQWDDNEIIETHDGFGGDLDIPAKELVEACDHFEDQHSYEFALAFIEMFNGEFGEDK